MKTFKAFLLLAFTIVTSSPAQGALVITSFSQNGELVCSNLETGSVASVEWAASLSGPWQTNWAGLDAVAVASNGTIQVSVPMFYRVRGVAATPTNMSIIPAGSFTMGDTFGEQTASMPVHSVYVSAFYMDKYEVSRNLWQEVYSWSTGNGYSMGGGSGKGLTHPQQSVAWYDIAKWCNARSEKEGLTPCYYTDASQTIVYRSGNINLTNACVKWTANGYRLPTEVEWEKAARGGTSGKRFPWGNTISESQANYYGCTDCYSYDLGPNGYNSVGSVGGTPYTSPVGSFAPNGYGLYDMAGNVWEWCWDWYDDSWYGQPSASSDDPHGPPTVLSARVLRGGAWSGYAIYAQCAYRVLVNPVSDGYDFGFRCVRGF